MNLTHPALWLAVAGWLSGPLLPAQTNDAPTGTLPFDVVPAVLNGIEFFRAQAATNDEAWLCHPIPGKKVIGHRTVEYRYKNVEITIPGHRYESYQVLVPGNSPTDPLRRETRQRIVGRDPSKDHTVTREVRDPKGPIVRQVQVPIYEKDTGHQWRLGGLGNNGWAMLALRRCGVTAEDALVNGPATSLAQLVLTFGWPDSLHDVAGLTAGFAVMPGADFQQLTENGAAKLLDAQITTGPATGLWGPIAVNPAMLSAFLKALSAASDERKEILADLTDARRKKVATKIKRLEQDLQQLDARSEALQTAAQRVTQLGLRMFEALGTRHRGSRVILTVQAATLGLEAWPYLAHNQTTADLDSTAQAVLALRIAFENGRLPARSWRPAPLKPAGPGQSAPSFPPARDTRDVLSLAVRAVTAARTGAGLWPELNIHQPVTDLAWLQALPPLQPNASPQLPQPVTLASTVRGAATLANLHMIQAGAARPTALENAACQPLFDSLRAGKPLTLSNEVHRTPFEALWQTTALRDQRGKSLRTDFTTWNEVAEWLTKQQTPSGGWGRPSAYVPMPSTSLRALKNMLPDLTHAELAKRYDQAHLAVGFFAKRQPAYHHAEYEAPYFTIAALLFLADGLPADWTPPANP